MPEGRIRFGKIKPNDGLSVLCHDHENDLGFLRFIRSGISQGYILTKIRLLAHFDQCSVRTHHECDCLFSERSIVLEASFYADRDLHVHSLAAATRRSLVSKFRVGIAAQGNVTREEMIALE